MLGLLAFLALVASSSQQKTAGDYASYVGAVVEYNEYNEDSTAGSRSLENFRKILSFAASKNVDVIVFPKLGIESRIDWPEKGMKNKPHTIDPELKIAPCDLVEKYGPHLQQLSCATREYQLYVVFGTDECVGACESRDSTKHPKSNSTKVFSSVIALDRDGRLVARYRQFNYLSRQLYARPTGAEPVTFNTDFGVTFALLAGDDLLARQPLADHLERGVVNFILSRGNVSAQAFMSQLDAGWAYVNDVDLLVASNAHRNVTGSGIYEGRSGPVERTDFRAGESHHAILLTRLRLDRRRGSAAASSTTAHLFRDIAPPMKKDALPTKAHCDWRNMGEGSGIDFNVVVVDKTKPLLFGEREICVKDVCCNFQVRYTDKVSRDFKEMRLLHFLDYSYKLGVFIEEFTGSNGSAIVAEICAVIPAAPEQITKYLRENRVTEPLLASVQISRRAAGDNSDTMILPMLDAQLWRPDYHGVLEWNMTRSYDTIRVDMANRTLVGPFGLLALKLVGRDDGQVDRLSRKMYASKRHRASTFVPLLAFLMQGSTVGIALYYCWMRRSRPMDRSTAV